MVLKKYLKTRKFVIEAGLPEWSYNISNYTSDRPGFGEYVIRAFFVIGGT